jgi:hypothetical protein
MHTLVKLLINEDEDVQMSNVWHFRTHAGGSYMLLCTGEVYDTESHQGEGYALAVEKTVQLGGITCPDCMDIIKNMKSIKL